VREQDSNRRAQQGAETAYQGRNRGERKWRELNKLIVAWICYTSNLINSRKIRRQVLSPEQQAARIRARARMDEGWPIGAGRLDRDSLHERSADRES